MVGTFTAQKPTIHSPDASLRRQGAKYPSIVIETSFSQKRKDLPRLAEDYIIGSRGNIRMVVGLDIEYSGGKMATVSIWQPQWKVEEGGLYLAMEQLVKSELFRNNDASLVQTDAVISVPMSIFALPHTDHSSHFLRIPYTKLYTFLMGAEAEQQTKEKDGFEDELPAEFKLKMREISPDEELKSADEAWWASKEEEIEKRVDSEDKTWNKC